MDLPHPLITKSGFANWGSMNKHFQDGCQLFTTYCQSSIQHMFHFIGNIVWIRNREFKSRSFLKPGVCGFDGLQTRVPGYPGLSVWQPTHVDGKPTVSGHLSHVRERLAIRRLLYATWWPAVNGSNEFYEHDIVYIYITHFSPTPTWTVQWSMFKNEPNSSTLGLNRLTNYVSTISATSI